MGNRDPATLDWFGDASYVIAPAKNVLIEPELIRRIPIADIPPTPEEKLFRQIEKETGAVKARTEYQATEAARLANMHRLRATRLAREAAP